MTTEYFRPMPASEIIVNAQRLFLENLARLVLIALLPQSVLLALELGLNNLVEPAPFWFYLVLLATILLNAVALSAITTVVAGAVLGGPPTLTQAYALTFRNKLLWVIAAYIITAVATSLGLILFIIPGLLLGGLLAPTIPIIVVEGIPVKEAISRSITLMREELAKGVAVFAFVIIISGLLPLILQIVVGVGPLTPLLGALLGAVTLPLAYTATVLLYFSVRSNEGFSPEQLEENLNERMQQ